LIRPDICDGVTLAVPRTLAGPELLDLVGLQLVVDVTPACSLLSTDMVAQGTCQNIKGDPSFQRAAKALHVRPAHPACVNGGFVAALLAAVAGAITAERGRPTVDRRSVA
jgi:hypothetical protein